MFFWGARGPRARVDRRATTHFQAAELLWALGSLSALHGKSFSAELLAREFPATADEPHNESTLIQAAQRLGFKVKAATVSAKRVIDLPLPLLVTLQGEASEPAFVSVGQSDEAGAPTAIRAPDPGPHYRSRRRQGGAVQGRRKPAANP